MEPKKDGLYNETLQCKNWYNALMITNFLMQLKKGKMLEKLTKKERLLK